MNTTAKRSNTGRPAVAALIAAAFGSLCVFAGVPYWSIPVGAGTYCAAAWALLKV